MATLAGMSLHISCVCCHSHYEFMCRAAELYLEDTFFVGHLLFLVLTFFSLLPHSDSLILLITRLEGI